MKTLIVYYSKYGSTAQYAKWINAEVEADIFSVSEAEDIHLDDYETIVFGTFIYAGTLTFKISSLIVDHWEQLKDKRVALFTVSAESPWSAKTQTALERSLPSEYRRDIAFFPLWGRINYKKMKFMDKMVAKMVGLQEVDEVKQENVKPLIKFIKTGKR